MDCRDIEWDLYGLNWGVVCDIVNDNEIVIQWILHGEMGENGFQNPSRARKEKKCWRES